MYFTAEAQSVNAEKPDCRTRLAENVGLKVFQKIKKVCFVKFLRIEFGKNGASAGSGNLNLSFSAKDSIIKT